MADIALERLTSSYPFDSIFDKDNPKYDEDGYPIMDRAVNSRAMRAAFRQFFSSGIFGTPSTNFQLTKGSGFSINIAKGYAIIDGGFGGIIDDYGMSVTLSNETIRGNQVFSVFVRLDDNIEGRSLFVRVAQSNGSTPEEPIIEGGVHELRLGYITVPSNAIDLSDATIYDERGTSLCPYAAPFMEVDIAGILDEVKGSAFHQYDEFMAMLNANIEFIQSALDDTTAGYLQNRMNELQAAVDEALQVVRDDAVLRSKIDSNTLWFDEYDNLAVKRDDLAKWLGIYPKNYHVKRSSVQVTDGQKGNVSGNSTVSFVRDDMSRLTITQPGSIQGTLSNGVQVNTTVTVPNVTDQNSTLYLMGAAFYDTGDGGAILNVLYTASYAQYTQMTRFVITSDGAITATSEPVTLSTVSGRIIPSCAVQGIGSVQLSFFYEGKYYGSAYITGKAVVVGINKDGVIVCEDSIDIGDGYHYPINQTQGIVRYSASSSDSLSFVSNGASLGTYDYWQTLMSASYRDGNLDFKACNLQTLGTYSAHSIEDVATTFDVENGNLKIGRPTNDGDIGYEEHEMSASSDIPEFSQWLFFFDEDAIRGIKFGSGTADPGAVFDSRYGRFSNISYKALYFGNTPFYNQSFRKIADDTYLSYPYNIGYNSSTQYVRRFTF